MPAPSVASIIPAIGSNAGGTPVAVLGQFFLPGATVQFGGVNATGVTVAGDGMSLVCTAPGHAEGVVDVKVQNPDGQSGILANGFFFAPTVYNVVPSTAHGVNVRRHAGCCLRAWLSSRRRCTLRRRAGSGRGC